MARKLFVVKATRLRGGTLADAETFTAYTDAAATVLADISLTSGGSAIAGSTFELDELGRAMIWGPTDDTSNLFLRSTLEPGLPVQQITADADARLDTLEAGVSGIPATIFDAKGDIIGASAADTAARLAVGANDTVLTADSTTGTGLKWAATGAHPNLATHDALGLATDAELATHAAAANPHSVYATDTDLSTHEADTTAIHGIADTSALATTSSVTSAVSTHAGLADPHTGYVLESLYDAKGDLLGASADNTPAKLTVGANDTVLTADSTAGTGLKWSAPAAHPNLATHDSLGLATDAELTTHAGAADPHTGYVLESLYDAKGDLLAASADNTPAKVTAGANATILVADSTQTAGVKWAYGNAVAKHTLRSSGHLTLNSTSWTNLDTGMDLTLPAATGDIIEVGLGGIWAGEAVQARLDVATIVAGSPVTYFSNATGTSALTGVVGWIGLSGVSIGFGGPAWLTLVSGDISAGTVTLRLRYQTDIAGNKSLLASTNDPLRFGAKNLGPAAA